MRVRFSKTAHIQYETLPDRIQKAVDKQLEFLCANVRHPSLRAKKYDESIGLWQVRITKDWRLWFILTKDMYEVQGITKHPK